MATNAFGWNTYDDLTKPSTKAKGGIPLPGWEVPANAGMYGARTAATNPPTEAIPTPTTPPPTTPPPTTPPAARATPAAIEAAEPDARWNIAISGIGPKGEYQFDNAGLTRAGYDRPEIYNRNVVPKETVSGMLGNMINPGGEQALSAALQAAAARGDWDAVGRYYASKGQSFGGKMYGSNAQERLMRMALGNDGDVMSRHKRDRAALILNQMRGNESDMAREQMRNALQREITGQQTDADRFRTEVLREGNIRSAGIEKGKLEIMEGARAEASDVARLRNLSAFLGTDAGRLWYSQQPKDKQAEITRRLANIDLGEAVVEGKAEGGVIHPVTNPMGNMGMPSSMATLDPAVRQYAQYVSTATQYGLQPVAFPKFIDLLGAARNKLMQLPTQGGQYSFADGGMVDWLKGLMPGVGPLDNPAPRPAPQPSPAMGAEMLGSGAANRAAGMIQNRNALNSSALEEAMAARRGYAGGGAIPVAGQQVLGPGGPKSDSIPAVIDGMRPAALSSGEFVFPTEAVQYFGTDKLNKMIQKARGQ